ncbi:MAG: hypothetical protein NTZ33_04415 [Bacteroidetes bacterium]|nr:hypothetical protein [Bacteroidota bacterium]
MNLQLNEAQQMIDVEKKSNPSNKIPYYLENYKDFISIAVSQDKASFDRLLAKRSDMIDLIAKDDQSSPYYNYCLADVYFQWAVARLLFMKDMSDMIDGIKAALEFKKSYEIIEKNQSKFPNFAPNLKLLGLMRALVDVVPANYKTIVKSLAFDGSFEQGTAELMQLTDKAIADKNIDFVKSEALFLLTFVEINLQANKQKALFLKKYYTNPDIIAEIKSNAVLLYAKARYDIFFGRNDEAIQALEAFPRGNNVAYFGFVDYLCGKTKLNRLDKDAANYFLNYNVKYKGAHYIKASYQHLAWYYLLNNDVGKYTENMKKAARFGAALSEIDKQALYEANRNEPSNVQLMKARLLCDGGYFQQALKNLDENTQSLLLKTDKDSLEFYYRLGRIYHEWDKTDNAVPYYEKVLRKGCNAPWYFATNAALQLGLIYENRKDLNTARLYFKRCLSMSPKEYKNSLHTKAKAGLKRIGG